MKTLKYNQTKISNYVDGIWRMLSPKIFSSTTMEIQEVRLCLIWDLGGRIPCLKKLMEGTSSNILIVAYRGFSDSDGSYKPNEAEIIKDASAIL